MLDLPVSLTQSEKADLLSHEVRTPLHQLLNYLNHLETLAAKIYYLALKPSKKKIFGELSQIAVEFKISLRVMDKQIEALSRLEKGQNGDLLASEFKADVVQLYPILIHLQATRTSQLKVVNNAKKLEVKAITQHLTRIGDDLSTRLKEAKTAVEKLNGHLGIEMKTFSDECPLSPLPRRFDSLHVLIVDDDKINREILARMLKNRNYQCTLAVNGQEAVNQCLSKKFDMILMDIQMPVMDGYEATRQIRQQEKEHSSSPTPIIAVSAVRQEEGAKKACLAGMDDFLSKPFKGDHIDSLIVKHVIKETTSPLPSAPASPTFSPAPLDLKSTPPSPTRLLPATGLFSQPIDKVAAISTSVKEKKVEGNPPRLPSPLTPQAQDEVLLSKTEHSSQTGAPYTLFNLISRTSPPSPPPAIVATVVCP